MASPAAAAWANLALAAASRTTILLAVAAETAPWAVVVFAL